jgi:hypothetical protein
MTVVYEQSFDGNEWFVIITLALVHLLMILAPKKFTLLESCAYYLYGITVVYFFDHSLSVKPWDYYDVNDTSSYQFMDFLYYVLNGPISYFFVYLYVKLGVRGYKTIWYLLIWSGFSVFIEWVGLKLGLFHYDKGYKMYWSFPIYMVVQTLLLLYFNKIRKTAPK